MPTAEIIDGKAVYYCFIRVRSLREKRSLEFWKFNLQIEQMLLGSKEMNFFSEWGKVFFFFNFLWMEGVVLWIDVRYQRTRTLIPQLGGWRNKRHPQSWGMLLDYPRYCQCQRKIQRLDMNIEWEKNWTDTSNLKLLWSSEAWCYRMAYKVKMKRMFNLYNDWLLHCGFPDGRKSVKSNYKILGRWLKFCLWSSETLTQNKFYIYSWC